MKYNTVERRVRVFISSRECRANENGKLQYERYKFIRRAIKELLEETNMVTVFVREIDGGDSSSLQDECLREIQNSHICVFIIDNHDDKDAHGEGVILEYNTAKRQGKKCLFFFCKEYEKSATQIEKEQKTPTQPSCNYVNSFEEFPNKIYHTVINAIFNSYHNQCFPLLSNDNISSLECNQNTNSIVSTVETSRGDSTDNPILQPSTYSQPKYDSKAHKLLYREFIKVFGRDNDDWSNDHYDKTAKLFGQPHESSNLDEICAKIFRAVICKEKADDALFNLMEEEILKLHDSSLHEILKLRISVIQNWFNGNLEECMNSLSNAYECVKNNSNISNWFMMDILIDCRNIQSELSNNRGKAWYGEDYQKWQGLIGANKEKVQYPHLDRCVQQHYQEIAKFTRKNATLSPHTIQLGRNNALYESCMEAFVIAVSNVSWTQIVSVKDRLIESLSAICCINAHKEFVSLIGLLLINNNDEELENNIRAFGYKQNISSLNTSDIKSLFDMVSLISVTFRKEKALIILFQYFGYYISDEEYKIHFPEFWSIVEKCYANKGFFFDYTNIIIKAVESNAKRIDSNLIVKFIEEIVKKRFAPYSQKAVNLLNLINLEGLENKNIQTLCDTFLEISKSCKEKENRYGDSTAICTGLLLLRKIFPVYADVIDKNTLEDHNNYYFNVYALELNLPDEDGNPIDFTGNLINEARRHNESQGRNGCYSGYASEPLLTLANLIQYSPELIINDIDSIIDIAKETILTNTQTISAKCHAVELILKVCNYSGIEHFENSSKFSIDALIEANQAIDNDPLSKDTPFVLFFFFTLLEIRLKKNCLPDLLYFLSYPELPEYEQIRLSKAMFDFSKNINWENIESDTIFLILQFAFSCCRRENNDVRIFSTRLLFELMRSPYQELICKQLSVLVDIGDNAQVFEIVNAIKNSENIDKELRRFILQKARASNHFIIRNSAMQHSESEFTQEDNA